MGWEMPGLDFRVFMQNVCTCYFLVLLVAIFLSPLLLCHLSLTFKTLSFLATTMFEAGNGKGNPEEFAVEINTILEEFEFPEEFIFDVWGAISDAKQGRL